MIRRIVSYGAHAPLAALLAFVVALTGFAVSSFLAPSACFADEGGQTELVADATSDAGVTSDAAATSGTAAASSAGVAAGAAQDVAAGAIQADTADVLVRAKVKGKGWKKATGGNTAGVTANKPLRKLSMKLQGLNGVSGSICYKTYAGKKWSKTAKNGAVSAQGSKNVKAVKVWLAGAAAKKYDVYYRVYVRGYKWLGWAKGKKTAGVGKSMSSKVTAIQVKLVKKGAAAPGSTAMPYLKTKWAGLEYKYLANDSVDQILEVKYTGGSKAKVVLRAKRGAGWKTVVSCKGYVGRAGIGKAREGSTRTPSGNFAITQAFGIKSDPGAQLDYVKVTRSMWWCGDRGSLYNKLIDINEHPHSCSGEHLIDYAPHYNYGLFFDYNTHPVKQGAGSAFFVHCTGGTPYTGGCIAVSQANMIKIIRNVSDGARLCIYKT